MNARRTVYFFDFGQVSAAFALVLLQGCVTDIEVGRSRTGQTDDTPNDGGERGASDCVEARCRGPVLQCGDCLDNDGDGLIDDLDPDCFGPCSDTEDSLLGRAQPCTNESCFFAFDCGEGNDETCSSLVPNGCDCHGCCETGERTVQLGSLDADGNPSCTNETLDDAVSCQSCAVDPACFNGCDACELCFRGDPPAGQCDEVDGCPVPTCPEDVLPCSDECGLSCPANSVCVTGCCAALR